MNLQSWRIEARRQIARILGEEALCDVDWMLCSVLGFSRGELNLRGDPALSQDQISILNERLTRRLAREPLQYIEGETWFMGLRFQVTPDVLIPQPDTEILAEQAIRRIGGAPLAVLDLGTGSGAIACAIARNCPNARVTATDLSCAALEIARGNAERLGLSVTFLQGDLFDPVVDQRFDLIVSNPPYLSDADMAERSPEVAWEPSIALSGGKDGMIFYRRIAVEAPRHMLEGGYLLLETGAGQAKSVLDLLDGGAILMDYGGNERVVERRYGQEDCLAE